jgi:hypothetical protein
MEGVGSTTAFLATEGRTDGKETAIERLSLRRSAVTKSRNRYQ